MARFIQCSTPETRYRTANIVNSPVNIDLCTTIQKFTYAHYPDNTGTPAIRFKGNDVEWIYNSEKVRDADFERISTNQFLKDTE